MAFNLRTLFATARKATKEIFGEESLHRRLTCGEFSDASTYIQEGTTIEYFLRAQRLHDGQYDMKLLARGRGMDSILPPPFLGVRYYHVSDIGVMSAAYKKKKMSDFNAGYNLDRIIDQRDAFLMHLVNADNHAPQSRMPVQVQIPNTFHLFPPNS